MQALILMTWVWFLFWSGIVALACLGFVLQMTETEQERNLRKWGEVLSSGGVKVISPFRVIIMFLLWLTPAAILADYYGLLGWL